MAALAVAVLTLAGWAALLAEAFRAGGGADAFLGAICRPVALERGSSAWSLASAFAASAALWIVMSVAMMLPTAAPMALAYADVAERRAAQGLRSPSPLLLIGGYLGVWAVISVAAAALQSAAGAFWPLLGVPERAAGVLAGFAIGGAGLYQFSDMKLRCLAFCRTPVSAFEAGLTERPSSALRLGVQQGVQCLGCCGATMALMLVAGTMNLLWMGVFALLNTVEKVTAGGLAPRIIGAGLILAGLGVAVSAVGFDLVWRAMVAR
ncbi:DUF2182 domain-containing protein [Alsobacter soli]|uniref:DUF2182 domain-containing protein n=1 Tax=Alsobacter soli TaxID=2109933 RepID=UPI001AEC8B5C|nr:DUF2182 domain-containing protein [Alsobacter soli]